MSPCRIQMLNGCSQFVVTDDKRHNINIFNTAGVHGHVTLGGPGYGYCEFMHPCAVDEDGEGNLVVVDRDNHRLHIVTKQGAHVALYGMLGAGEREFDCPRDVKVCDNGLIVVLDGNNRRLVGFH